MAFLIEEYGFDKERIASQGNKFFTGNGYLGIRGTLQELGKEDLVAINLAGIYDQVGDGWREPLNAPNGLYTYVEFDGIDYKLPEMSPLEHKVCLDFRHGIHYRNTKWNTPNTEISIKAERFASLDNVHLIAMKYSICTKKGGEIKLYTGIDGDVWDINGPHYDEIRMEKDTDVLHAEGITHELKERVIVCEKYQMDGNNIIEDIQEDDRKIVRRLSFYANPGETYILYKYISVYTSKDDPNFKAKAYEVVNMARKSGYDFLLENHRKEWDRIWNVSEVVIEGDEEAMAALNYSIYQLQSIAPRHADNLSIAARGLSGQTYKGAVFWDTEMFMLDLFLYTDPNVVKSFLKYRIDTLKGAKKKALYYGYQGAFYPWESQEGGHDACTDYNVVDVFTSRGMRTYFKDKQVHISSAIVYGMMKYISFTNNLDVLNEGGAKVIIECAIFYYSLLIKRLNNDYYEIHDVIGPDEYHERVNNNAYTNRMAKYTFDSAIYIINLLPFLEDEVREKILGEYKADKLLEQFKDASSNLYIPQPDLENKIIEQFDGYRALEDISLEEVRSRLLNDKEYWGGAYGVASQTKIIKQADVITMLDLFSDEYDEETLLANWNYYEPRTEHGSSLSACMYSLVACKCHMPDKAYPFFMKSATSDLVAGGKEWAGLIYIGGTHPASSGGAYMTAINGFGGLYQEDGELKVSPRLPSHWKRLKFNIVYKDELYHVDITKGNTVIKKQRI